MTIMYAGAANVDTGLEWFPMWYAQSGGMNPTWDHQPGSVRRVLVARRKRHRGRGDTGCWHYLPV